MSEEHLEYGQRYTFSSGIPVIVLPFPSLRFDKFIKLSKKKFPLPAPPKKKIKVLDGEETVDNPQDKKYLRKLDVAESKQNEWLSEKILRVCLRDCIELDLSDYEHIITALEEDNEEPFPENPLSRKTEFLIEYVIRSAKDFQALTKIATDLMKLEQVTEVDVTEEVDSF